MLFFKALGQLMLACVVQAGVLNHPSVAPIIPGKFVVWFKNDTTYDEIKQHINWAKELHENSVTNPHGYKGFGKLFFSLGVIDLAHYVGDFDNETFERIEKHPAVLRVDREFYVEAPEDPHGKDYKPDYIIIPNDDVDRKDRQKKLGRIDIGPD